MTAITAPTDAQRSAAARRPLGPGAALLGSGLGGIAWFWLFTLPPRSGYPDTDDPSVSLAFLRAQPHAYAWEGLALLVLALGLLIGALGVGERLPRTLGSRVVTVLGATSAVCFGLFGVLRLSVGPILYVDGLDHSWGEIAYLIAQFVGPHGTGQAGILLLSTWIGGVAWIGGRAGAISKPLAVLAILPALRLVGLLGPLGIQIGGIWLLYMLSIPLAMVWLALVGVAELRRAPTG